MWKYLFNKKVGILTLDIILGVSIGLVVSFNITVTKAEYNKKTIERDLIKAQVEELDRYDKEINDIIDNAKTYREVN